jgi:hypothetical protein
MVVRGGPVTHAVARAGWLVFALLGVVAMIVVAVFFAADPGDDISTGAAFVGGLIVFIPIGAAIGALIGLPVQFAVRSWLRNPSPAERLAAREKEARAARLRASGLRPRGRWARSYRACAKSVTAYHAVLATLPDGAGRDWFAGIGETLDAELTEALRLAQVGESLDPGGGVEPDGTALRALELLRAAETSFADTTERAAAIALDLRDGSDFVRVRAQLDMLAEQAPQLRAADLD